MKKVMFALCFMFGGIVTLTAQDTQDTTSNQYRTETQSQYPQDNMNQQDAMSQQQDRERIQSTELPSEVKRALEGEEYRGWLVSGAFKSQGSADQSMGTDTTSMEPSRQEGINAVGAEDEEIYIVELKNGAETKEVRFDSNGQILEGTDDQMNNQNGQFNQDNQQNNEYNQNNRNDQLNRNDQMSPTTPSDQGLPADPSVTDPNVTDPNSTTDPTSPSSDPTNPTPGVPADPNAIDQPDQAGQSQSIDQSQSPSTGTPSGQPQTPGSTTDQSRANEPK